LYLLPKIPVHSFNAASAFHYFHTRSKKKKTGIIKARGNSLAQALQALAAMGLAHASVLVLALAAF
jgi:rhodanese-related sulfurtransferase